MKTKKSLLLLLLFLFIVSAAIGCGGQAAVDESDAGLGKDINKVASEQGKAPETEIDQTILKAKVEGNVEQELEFAYSDFTGQETTVTATYTSCKETLDPQEYTGVPLALILEKAKPLPETTKLTIIGADNYKQNYVLEDVMANQEILLSQENGYLQIIMDGKDASYWVRDVVRLVVQ